MVRVHEGEAHAVQRVRLVERHCCDAGRRYALVPDQEGCCDGGAIDLTTSEAPVQPCDSEVLEVSVSYFSVILPVLCEGILVLEWPASSASNLSMRVCLIHPL